MRSGVRQWRVEIGGSGDRSGCAPGEIALLDWGGDGPVALLHHANGFCAALFAGVALALRSKFRVIALDARGHGDSCAVADIEGFGWSDLAKDLEAVADAVVAELGVERIALGLGHSFGGSLTAVVASKRPFLYERIAMVDPVVFPRAVSDAVTAHGRELVERTLRRRRHFESREQARAHFSGRALFEAWQPWAFDGYVEEGMRAAPGGGVELKCAPELEAQIFGGSRTLDLQVAASKLQVPALCLFATGGNFDRALHADWVSRMQKGELRDIEGGHLVPMEDPARVAFAVLEFCASAREGGS
ncbi:MAG: alpha/beta hydrolase [Myxococcota bacterium]